MRWLVVTAALLVAPEPVETQTVHSDPAQSAVGFELRALGDYVGHFEDFEAHVDLEGDTPRELVVIVQTASLVTDSKRLTKHLKEPKYLDVEQFPTARFESTKLRHVTADLYRMHGEFTLHGVTEKLEVPVRLDLRPDVARGKARLVVDPADYGMTHGSWLDPRVTLDIGLVFDQPR